MVNWNPILCVQTSSIWTMVLPAKISIMGPVFCINEYCLWLYDHASLAYFVYLFLQGALLFFFFFARALLIDISVFGLMNLACLTESLRGPFFLQVSVITGWEQQSRNMYMRREVENRTTMEPWSQISCAVATGVARTGSHVHLHRRWSKNLK